jgi:LacI family transcriptional regulator
MSGRKAAPRTIADLGRIAGVSASTVSRVLNDSGYVNPRTRRKVENVIKAHGFTPNRVARSLATARTSLIGLIVPSLENPVYLEILKGVNASAIEQGYSVVLSQSGEEPESVRESMMHLAALRVDGIIATQPEVHDVDLARHLTPFLAEKIPIARLGTADNEWKIDGVLADSFETGRLAAEHLLQLGYERIAVLGSAVNPQVKLRLEGIRSALLARGLPLKNLQLLDADFSQSGGAAAALEALQRPDRPSALLALNDVMAIGALMAAESLGLAVPSDVAVVGIDGIPVGQMVRPRLSTVVLPTFEMGRALFEMIHSRLDGTYSGKARQAVFHVRMLVRDSTLPVRRAGGAEQ